MPRQNRATSKQDYETPPDFLAAIAARWGTIDVDLAARADNAKAAVFVTPEEDTLTVPWAERFMNLNCFLNPEFRDIDPYAEKCAYEGSLIQRGRIFMLTPASIGTNWFSRHVEGRAMVLGLAPRLRFVGEREYYPKDLMLSIFAPGIHGFGTWRWKD